MSSSSSNVSRASSNANGDPDSLAPHKSISSRSIKYVAQSTTAQDVLLFLVAFRLLNALTVKTFFQPDEYFQSLEPAWKLAFGQNSGAWITWEWKNYLRSAIHPALFAVVYRSLDALAGTLNLSAALRADVFLAGPKILQAVIAALGDYYTWKLGDQIYGRGSSASWAALILTVVSPWQWFCSTRTLSNCLETTLTIAALYNWPWHWSASSRNEQKTPGDDRAEVDVTTSLRRCILLAALASILRPTNVLIWGVLALLTFFRCSISQMRVKIPWIGQSALVRLPVWTTVATKREWISIIRDGLLCGATIISLSVLVDRLFYGVWTFPPLNFLHFNVLQSLAVFYGNNNWHYYLSQGYPLLLTMALPFALLGIYRTIFLKPEELLSCPSKNSLKILSLISLIVPAALSILSHKEVRFIYPLLPPLHIISALPVSDFFGPALLHEATHPKLAPPYRLMKRLALLILLVLNFTIAIYTTSIHNSGLISVTHYLRNEFSSQYFPHSNSDVDNGFHYLDQLAPNMTVAFLMPCHSTPWRSHLQNPPTASHPGISAWALTCEPPLNLTPQEKAVYKDEADIFYEHPSLWLRRNMMRSPRPSMRAQDRSQTYVHSRKREWPDYVVFFEQLEGLLNITLRGSGYALCKGGRIWNSAWHDDWRRTGDIMVWCLHPGRQAGPSEEEKARAKTSAEGPMAWLKGAAGLRRDRAEAASQKITPSTAVPERVELTVEKPFWKQLVPEPAVERGRWWEKLPGLTPKQKRSWWVRVRDEVGL